MAPYIISVAPFPSMVQEESYQRIVNTMAPIGKKKNSLPQSWDQHLILEAKISVTKLLEQGIWLNK